MRISDSHRLLFVHIQKTGGVSIEEILETRLTDLRVHKGTRHPTRHPTLAQILRHEPALVDYWTFSFVRNPWDRMVSWWSMIDRNTQEASAGRDISRERMERRRFWMGVAAYPDFETFVSKGPEEFARLRRPQVDYLVTPRRRPDWIGRTENIASDARILFERLGLPADTPTASSQQEPAWLIPGLLRPCLTSSRRRALQSRHRGVRLRVLSRDRARTAQRRRDGHPLQRHVSC